MYVSRWTVDYGDGPHPAIVPHAWAQEVSVEWEGPATYRTEVDVPRGGGTLRFWGVSYLAEVLANGELVARHEGIWDAFDVPLPGGKVELEVRVTKNGGPTYPVHDVLSGSLPHMHQTFGGIYREVELLELGALPLSLPPTEARPQRPYLRGLLHQGWYPEIGHPNPDEHVVRREVRAAKALGFNLVKFDRWLPPHRYLDVLKEEGMLAWIELPLGHPTRDRLDSTGDEIERIVLQYRRHPSILIWSIGGEPSDADVRSFRRKIVGAIQALTGCADVVDSSEEPDELCGDRRAPGSFEVFSPRCELPFYAPVLDELRDSRSYPILGRFGDGDVHRDLARLGDELPFWASALPELNAQGIRSRYDLPRVLDTSRFALEPTRSRHKILMESSRQKALFVRKIATEAVRARSEFDGYVIDAWRDTPQLTSGIFDDWGNPRFSPAECLPWNGGGALFPLPSRCLQLANGGHRPGWRDPYCHFEGDLFLRLGADGDDAGEAFESGRIAWRIVDVNGLTVARGAGEGEGVRQLERAQVVWDDAVEGDYRLVAHCGSVSNEWPLRVVKRTDWSKFEGWDFYDPAGLIPELASLPGGTRTVSVRRQSGDMGILLLDEEGTLPMPFWRECVQEFADPTMERWERLLPISPDCALDPTWLRERFGEYQVLINRIDARSYDEHPLLVRTKNWLITTLRPQGGLGSQPPGLRWNPAGCAFLESLMRSL